MKKILITASSSYIGKNIEKWLTESQEHYYIESISVRKESWKRKDFSAFDVVLHLAGIAHQKETHKNSFLYYKVNRDLAYEVAKKSKRQGVKQFVFLSSMSVYGVENGVISKETRCNPKSNYGQSKLQAEELIQPLSDDQFKVCIIRPPMIYGKGCKGNYVKLSRLVNYIPFFPNLNNKRSMIYIDNLSNFIKYLIDHCKGGLFFPQNKDYVNTFELVKTIAFYHNKNIKGISLFNPVLNNVKTPLLNKIFGDLVYEKEMSSIGSFEDYCVYNFEESIKLTEE
ncbi:NAD-dependent epimerase/dehydratase family protein [Halobacillus andaensis]|uniref:NAD-dependent epimerase/dehydratase family protein n=1 Tax=Halobacillus andaensis TaxID=1176239 RepID=UPI003D710C43